VTLVRLDSPCEIQELLAQIWASRRPEQSVLAGNIGYLPGRVAFTSLAPAASDWPARLAAVLPPSSMLEETGDSQVGAVNGHVAVADWAALLGRLGLEDVWRQ
jgi:single-stranded-DNA-specific exonuclease